MAGPYIEAANRGAGGRGTIELLGHELSHSDALNVLNHHTKTKPSSAPSALFGSGLPWHYEGTDEHISGVGNMIQHIVQNEESSGEVVALIEQQVHGELENTLD